MRGFGAALLEEITQLARPTRVAQLAERLRLDLPDALAGHAEVLADLFQRATAAVLQPEPQLQHAPFTIAQRAQHVFHLLAQELERRRLRRSRRCQIRWLF